MNVIACILLSLLSLAGLAGLTVIYLVRASLPRYNGIIRLRRSGQKVIVRTDTLGVPSIQASSRKDAYWALGYLVARDRLFQIDLLRRSVTGHLAEIYGSFALPKDTQQRTLGLQQVAAEVVNRLPMDQLEVLEAYTQGINDYLRSMKKLPPECLLLRYKPQAWSVQDCILIGLYVFQDLTGNAEKYKRATSIMQKTLPADVVAFFTADEDLYPQVLIGGQQGRRPLPPLPVEALKSLLKCNSETVLAPLSDSAQQVMGSNSWVVGPARTQNGRTILANDMHLSLAVPNIWYKATLHYGETTIMGMTIPGLPGVMLGSNGHVSWGFTNSCGDFLDLIEIERNPANMNEYKTPEGWQSFEIREDQIAVRGKQPTTITIRSTIWGPVSLQPLMDKLVALHWTLLDPAAMNCQIMNMDAATDITEAVAIIQNFGAPPMNAMLADKHGHIGWTYCGKLPIRVGSDGFASRSWADGKSAWCGYVEPGELPCIVDPPEGFLCTANNRTTGKDYPYVIGYNYSSGYRASRIGQKLREMSEIDEESMFGLQLDTTSEFYQFYCDLLITLLSPTCLAQHPQFQEAYEAILSWDGRAELASTGIGLLTSFRELLAERVLGSYLALCFEADKSFVYGWNSLEAPLRILLHTRVPELVPSPEKYANWEVLMLDTLETCLQRLKQKHDNVPLQDLTWGQVQTIRVAHPFGFVSKLLGKIFDMPEQALPGTPFCIRATAPFYGATVRLVVSPSHEKEALFHTPGGQAGHPFARYYKNQYLHWVQGTPLPFLVDTTPHTLHLE